MEKKCYFEGMWKEIVSNTEDCINLLDDDVDEDGHIAEGLNEHIEHLRFKMDRLNLLEGDLELKLAATVEKKYVEPGFVDSVPPESVKELLEVVNNGKTSDSRTGLDSTSAGNATDKPVLKISPVASISSEDEVKTEPENVELDVSDSQEIANGVRLRLGNKSMFENLGTYLILKQSF